MATVLASNGSPHGLTISSFTSVSLRPPLILFCVDHGCSVLPHFRAILYFAINILTDLQRELSVIFSANPEGRFDSVDWRPGTYGAPILGSTLACLECETRAIYDQGDHAIIIGEALSVHANPGQPLVYYNRNYKTLL